LRRARRDLKASLALARPPYAAARIAAFLDKHLCWTAFWDKNYRVWRVAENDPDSDLYAESRDADAVIKYMTAHS
jgi:hypothetical protein